MDNELDDDVSMAMGKDDDGDDGGSGGMLFWKETWDLRSTNWRWPVVKS